MSDLTLRKCNICLSEYIPLDRVVFFQCGHNACRSCSEQKSYRDDPSCAECRKPKGLSHRIYLSSDDLVDEPAGHIINDLNGISADYSAERIASASKKIRILNNMERGNPDISKALLAATRDLEERLAPLATLYDEAKQKNQELLDRFQLLLSTSAAYQTEASRAKEIVKLHRHEERRLRERAQAYMTIINQKSSEIENLQMELKERDKKESLMKTKLKALAKSQIHKSSKTSHIGDTSLQVEAKSLSPITKRPAPSVFQSSNSPHAKPVKRRSRHRDTPSRIVE